MPTPVNRTPARPVDSTGKATGTWARHWPWAWLAQRVWPPRCLLCHERGHAGLDLCPDCAAGLPWNRCACGRCALPLAHPADACGACLRSPPPQGHARTAFVYARPLDRLLPRAKFHGDLATARLLAQLMAREWQHDARPDALVAVPLHWRRLRERGYDQALELARPLANALGLPLREDLLRRVRETAPQSRLDAAQRRRNLLRAFAAVPGAAMPAHVVLFDDVMTTGATLHAATRVLLRAGATRVDAWACARVP